MRLGIFYSDLDGQKDTLARLKADQVGVFLVSNGIYHAVLKAKADILNKENAKFYALLSDLETRGFTAEEVDRRVSVISYQDLVNLMVNDYDKLAWL